LDYKTETDEDGNLYRLDSHGKRMYRVNKTTCIYYDPKHKVEIISDSNLATFLDETEYNSI
jgi:hypothetical protein